MMIANRLRALRSLLVGSFLKRLIVQLGAEDRAFLVNALVPDIRLAMGFPVPLSSPLTNDVYSCTASDFLATHCDTALACPNTQALDLGCGTLPQNPFNASTIHGVDIRAQGGSDVVRSDLFNDPIPCEDASYEFVTAFDFIEHIPRTVCERGSTRFPFVQLMDEIARVLKPGGLFFSSTPAFPSQQTFQDPTHVNPITENTFPFYFCRRDAEEPWARMYGFKAKFCLVSQRWSGYQLLTLMRKEA